MDSITFLDELDEPFHYARDAITQIIFSHDNNYMAAAVGVLTQLSVACYIYHNMELLNVTVYDFKLLFLDALNPFLSQERDVAPW